jgi:hypothetical protein
MVVAFESDVHDQSEYIKTEYDGLVLHIKPSHDEYCNSLAVFLEPGANERDILTKINRFFSAMAWKDDAMFITRGFISGAAREQDRDKPRFNYKEKKRYTHGVISSYDFEHLRVVREPRQQLALALYREGLAADQAFYRFLSFYKIINILRNKIPQQSRWINANLDKVRDYRCMERLRAIHESHANVGEYLSKQGRCAIAHAFDEPIRDPDLPDDVFEIRADTPLIKGLAQVAIECELGVPSMGKIWNEHLYELAGFKDLFGHSLTVRLQQAQSIPVADFPELPKLSVRLRGHEPFAGLSALPMRILSAEKGIVVLGIVPPDHPQQVLLALNFFNETLDVLLPYFGIDPSHHGYAAQIEVGQLRFLRGLFGNGIVEIYDEAGRRLSHKTAFIPTNVDLRGTLKNFDMRIEALTVAAGKGD